MNIYVGNMSYESTESDLRSAFEAFGPIKSATVIMDKHTGFSKGFGFVEMATPKEGQSAIEGLNDTELKGRTITVNEARPRDDNRGGQGGHRGGRGDSRGGHNRQRY